MINIYYRSIKEAKISALERFKVGSWVDVSEPTEEDLENLEKMLGVEESLLKDALDPYEVPRLEQENGMTYVFTRVPERQDKEIVTVPILIVLGENFILTVARKKIDFLERFANGEAEIFTTQKTKFFLEIFSSINRRYNLFLIDIGKGIRRLKIKLEKMTSKDLIYFVDFERTLNDFLSSLIPTGSVLQKILDGRSISLYEEDRDLIEDIFLGNGQMVEMAKSTLRHVVNIRSTYSNIITQDLNRVIKILTSLTILLTIPTMIFSFYGMNVDLPYAGHPYSYGFIILITFAIAFSLLVLFRKNRWL